MIRILRRYGQAFELRWREARNLEDALRFCSYGLAHNFLSRFPPDPLNAQALRRVYTETHARRDTRGLTDRELLDALAWDLVSGTITVNACPRRRHEWVSLRVLEAAPPPASTSAPRPAAARPPVAPAPAPSPEAAVDAETQAASLTTAAQKGAPFCEECAKKQAQQQAAAP